MKNNLKWFCSILLLSAFPFPPQGSAFPVIHVLFKSVNHLPSFTDALRTCLIGQVCGISGKLAFNLPNPEPFGSFYEQHLQQGSGNSSLRQDQGGVSLFSESCQRNGLDEARGDWVSGGDQHSPRAVSSFPSECTGVEPKGLFALPK